MSAETIDDTVSDLLNAEPAALSGASAIVAELDGATLDAAQAVALAALGTSASLTLHATAVASTLTISDTPLNLANAAASITALESDGSVTVDSVPYTDRTILTAAAAAALVESDTSLVGSTLAVADTGSALSTVESQIFGVGFEAITVTSGSFAGTQAELLDPTLHFAAGSSAQLSADAQVSVAQAQELAALPGFNLASNVTLTILDSVSNILAAVEAADLPAAATSILANDTETVSAAEAATLATLTGFSLNGNHLHLNDTAANLASLATSTPGAIALATTVDLTSDARITEATALQFIAMGAKFSPNDFFVSIADTPANLAALAEIPADLTAVNSWNGEAVLSASGSLDVNDATAMSQLAGFNVGSDQLTIADSASNLLGASGSVLALAYAVQLSQASTVGATDAATLEALHNFSAEGLLAIADTPAALAAMAASVATPASHVTLAVETGDNASGYAIDAPQFVAMLALPHFSLSSSLSSFAGTVSVTDTAASLAALAPSLTGLTSPEFSHLTMTLDNAATVTVATAEVLDGLPGFSTGSGSLTISDTAIALGTLDGGTAALASEIELSTPATVNVATAAGLANLHNFTTDANPLTVSDTPENLAAQGAGVAAIAASETIAAYAEATSAQYTLTTTAFLDLVGYAVSFTGFSGPLIAQGTASQLVSVAEAFAAAVPGSTLAASRTVLTTELEGSTTVNAQDMAYLIGLPGFSLNSNTLILQDTPTALLNAFATAVPDAHEVELAASGTAWTVTAQQAAQLAAIGPLNAGPAGMIVSDTAANLLTAPYAAGIDAATATTLSANATVSVLQADALEALPDFSRGTYSLTISDTAAAIATLNEATAAIASSIVTIGNSSSLTASAFEALVSGNGFTDVPDSLVVSDSATALLTLVGNSHLGDIAATILNADATLVAADAEQLATLPHLQVGNYLTINDTTGNLLQITGARLASRRLGDRPAGQRRRVDPGRNG